MPPRNPPSQMSVGTASALTEKCFGMLENISTKLQENAEVISDESVANFKGKIKELVVGLAKNNKMEAVTKDAVESILGQRTRNESGETTETADELKRAIKQRIDTSMQGYLPSKERKVKEIVNILRTADDALDEDDDEDELLVINRALTDNDIKCPVSQMTMEVPMKNPGGAGGPSCIHRISQAGLQHLLRQQGVAKCPVAGCRGRWTSSAVRDEAFAKRVQTYLRRKRIQEEQRQAADAAESGTSTGTGQQGSSSSSGRGKRGATISVDDEDADFTQL